MKKNTTLKILFILIIIILIILGITIYENNTLKDVNKTTYPFETYSISIDNYTYINSIISNNQVYSLYKRKNDYILKKIDTTTKIEQTYNKYLSQTCKLINDFTPYISCKNNNKISIYDVTFTLLEEKDLTTEYDYTMNMSIYKNKYTTYKELIDSKCNIKCLQLRKDTLTNKINLYKDQTLKEENIKKYKLYENGIFTYNKDKIKIYNVNGDYKEFTSNIDITKRELALSNNEYILYIVLDNQIDIYNLYNKTKLDSIDISKLNDTINSIDLNNNKLYVFTSNNLYIFDTIWLDENSNTFGEGYINNKITNFKEDYGVNVYIKETNNIIHKDYNVLEVTNYNDIYDGLNYLENYFLLFNKDFFNRFYEYNMKGLSIYFAYDIKGGNLETDNTDVVGLSFVKNGEYVIIIKINSKENIQNVLYHETMHIIDAYLELRGFTYEWENLNPDYFKYENIYYPNVYYKDTISNGKSYQDIYFIDNYARVNEKEDRARIFESICNYKDYKVYPHIENKITYLKKVMTTYFPEVAYIKAFQ